MAKVTQLPLEIPKGLKASQRKAIADLVIEFMVDRTMSGKDKNGKGFPKYSKSYTESLDFQNAGKSSKVDLQLSGDMLAALTLLEHEDGKLLIGYEDGADEEGRAEGNILGSYGGEPNKKKARDFLGIKERNLKRIIDLVVNDE
jgi:hypothetical protein